MYLPTPFAKCSRNTRGTRLFVFSKNSQRKYFFEKYFFFYPSLRVQQTKLIFSTGRACQRGASITHEPRVRGNGSVAVVPETRGRQQQFCRRRRRLLPHKLLNPANVTDRHGGAHARPSTRAAASRPRKHGRSRGPSGDSILFRSLHPSTPPPPAPMRYRQPREDRKKKEFFFFYRRFDGFFFKIISFLRKTFLYI